ncbi:transcription factor TFIIIC subunit TFC8 Ecym_7319 [Eremothecium cymbalariae DBVPG|uniref:Transcription factor IIIC putative zinc-finger domain-containing protein n=1 Tax=Eremothecium cymbalariae (strain CBS 270.75 / DBVPG 7215 / KCTC 17166 / NRRL Y-17582) TaxID=931890 RepID=G8JWD8_ERECY|nr:hypothetical protein Ecym_7319 [Eremothecium cymbalariae DBVPG\
MRRAKFITNFRTLDKHQFQHLQNRMKNLRDLVIPRKELRCWEDSLAWARDGTLYITTIPEVTICQSLFKRQVNMQAKSLFHVKEYPMKVENKFEFLSTDRNVLINSQPEPGVVSCIPSPTNGYILVLTNNANVILFEGQTCISQIDEEMRGFNERSYRSMCWGPDGKRLAIGNENSELIIFTIDGIDTSSPKVVHERTIQLTDNQDEWVIGICWDRYTIVAYTTTSSIFTISTTNYKPQMILNESVHHISDVRIMENNVLVTRVGSFHRIDISSGRCDNLALGPYGDFYIVPIPNQKTIVLLSNKTSCKVQLQGALKLENDDIISPFVEAKLKRWNTVFNEFKKYETAFSIYGISTSPDGYSLAILYDIERVSFKYRILSELQYRIMFIPLADVWRITSASSGLAWYQNYHIYNSEVPENIEETGDILFDNSLDFISFLQQLRSSKEVNCLRFKNLITETPSDEWYKSILFSYAVKNLDRIVNPLDKACVVSLAKILKQDIGISDSKVEMKGEFISENFDFHKNNHPETVQSEDGNVWRRCAITYLPLLTTKVKFCPVSGQRIIDIHRDPFNDYGWFTKTLLEVFNDESIYTGTKMVTI